MEGSSLGWRRMLVSALTAVLVTVLSGMILFRLQSREPELVYEVIGGAPFEGTRWNLAVYHVAIRNLGAKPAENLRGVVRISGATLVDFRLIVEPTSRHSHEITGDTVELQMDELAQCERIVVSLLATSQTRLPDAPEVFVRGGGVTGVLRASSKPRAILSGWRRLWAPTYAGSGPAPAATRHRLDSGGTLPGCTLASGLRATTSLKRVAPA